MHTPSVNSELKENPKPMWISKLIWDKTKETDFLANFNSDILLNMCAHAVVLIDHNIDQALELFTSSILHASECMKKHMLTGNRLSVSDLFHLFTGASIYRLLERGSAIMTDSKQEGNDEKDTNDSDSNDSKDNSGKASLVPTIFFVPRPPPPPNPARPPTPPHTAPSV